MQKTVTTFCGICERSCGMQVAVNDNAVERVTGFKDHIRSKGDLCIKGRMACDILYAPDRLKYPMKKQDGQWKRITWDEALGMIADNLHRVKKQYGANALAVYHGQTYLKSTVAMFLMKRLLRMYGTVNLCSAASECFMPHLLSGIATFGSLAMPDIVNSKCVIVWGSNPFESGSLAGGSMPRTMRIFAELKEKGVRFITIDPRTTAVAKMSDIHIKVRPGTDGALALGMMRVLVDNNLYDATYVEQYTSGFDKLQEMLMAYDLETVETITGVCKDEIIKAARLFASNKPASIIAGVGVEHHTNTVQTIRAVSSLLSITGNIDVAGGNTFMSPVMFPPDDLPDAPELAGSPTGMNEHPFFVGMINQAHALVLIDSIISSEQSPVKALLVAGGAPILELANTNKVREAFGRLEFVAVIDLFMTETAKCADVVLPAAFFLERDEIGTMPVNLQRKAVDGGECLPDWEIWMKLARRMGHEKYFYWKSFEELAQDRLQSVGMTYEGLAKQPGGIFDETPPGLLLQNGFYTASGKIELCSQSLESCGYDPLPVYQEPAESPSANPERAAAFPLILITGGRRHMYLHSQHRTIPSLRKLQPEPLIDIHPATAGSYGMTEGDMALVESLRGTITIRVHCTEDILPGVVHIPHGWAEADCNVLTDHKNRDPVSGFPGLKSSLCRIKKIQ